MEVVLGASMRGRMSALVDLVRMDPMEVALILVLMDLVMDVALGVASTMAGVVLKVA